MKIKINRYTYELLQVDSNDENLNVGDNDFRSGITDFRTKKIYIAKGLSEDSQNYTIIHELTHAIMDSYGFLQVEWNDEIVADFMAIYVYEIERILNLIKNSCKNKIKYENLVKRGLWEQKYPPQVVNH